MKDRSTIAALTALEPISHRHPPGADRSDVDALLEADFVEVGASGAVYDREFVIETIAQRYARGLDPDDTAWQIDELSVQHVGPLLHLVTYRLTFGGRTSRRSTLWRKHDSNYRAVYHQGTLCDARLDSCPDQPGG
ncbi:DUF4440 domain-containing protein [Gordonia malaquae]|uniref:nuclear transport factor 2 family protein n=1 Tax=Gordonia malaquae TaxID=410332 RepID=UPI003AFB1CBD